MTRAPRDLPSRVRLAISRTGRTQAQVSALSGVPEETISRVVTGETANPRLDTLKKLARALNVSVGWLLGEPTANMSPEETKTVLAAVELARSRLVTYDTPSCPNAIPVGKLDGSRFIRHFADLDDLPPIDISPNFIRAGAEVVFRSADRSMLAAGIMLGEYVYVRGARSLRTLRGHVIVARLNNDYFIKRLIGPRDALVLASEDDRYSSIDIRAADEFYPFGLVVGRFADATAIARTWQTRHE
jgi:transcriptional regulator with XRE-family HTH domain